MLETLINYFFIFFIFSFIGWIIEIGLKFREFGRFVNRGFLIGPYCPIYGIGASLIVFTTNSLNKYDYSYAFVFIASVFICGLVEYLVSFYLEKKYHARWWDYSQKPMNLNGRIWIGNLILFGIGGLIIVEVLSPKFLSLFYRLEFNNRLYLSLSLGLLMLIDYIISYLVMKLIRVNIEESRADKTEEIKEEIKVLANNKNILYTRFVNAYPEVKFRTDRIKDRIRAVEERTDTLKVEAEKLLEEQKLSLKTDLKPTNTIKNEIIKDQEDLISLLEKENPSNDEILRLKNDIDENKNKLKKRRELLKIDKTDIL